MKTAILTILATTLLAGAAYAGEMHGIIKSVDMHKHMITMTDGMSVMTTKNVMLDHFMKGDKVTIVTDKHHMATKVIKKGGMSNDNM